MNIKEVLADLEKTAPPALQEAWDNSGLQIGDVRDVLKGMMVCVDVTREVIEDALEKGANLIIAHHPLFFSAIRCIDFSSYEGWIIQRCIQNRLCIYASHTAFDRCAQNMSRDWLLRLGCMTEKRDEKEGEGYLECGVLDEAISLREAAALVKREMGIVWMRGCGGEGSEKIRKIGVVSGSGGEFAREAKEKGCDLFITGEMKYHDFQKCVQMGLCAFEIGHFESEKNFIEIIRTRSLHFLNSQNEKIPVFAAKQSSFQEIF